MHLTISQDVEATIHLFFCMFMRDSAQSHLINTVLFSKSFFADLDLNLLSNLIALLFVFVTDVLFNQTMRILNLHVNWIIH